MSRRGLLGWLIVTILAPMGLWALHERRAHHEPLVNVPLVYDSAGRARLWSECPSEILIEVGGFEDASPEVRGAIAEAFRSWSIPGVPQLRFAWAPARHVSEDGHSTLSAVMTQQCASSGHEPGANCRGRGWDGLTAVYSRPAGGYSQIVEVDVMLNQKWATDSHKVLNTLVHELGHVLGLGHPSRDVFPDRSVMSTASTGQRVAPRPADIARLKEAYARACPR